MLPEWMRRNLACEWCGDNLATITWSATDQQICSDCCDKRQRGA